MVSQNRTEKRSIHVYFEKKNIFLRPKSRMQIEVSFLDERNTMTQVSKFKYVNSK